METVVSEENSNEMVAKPHDAVTVILVRDEGRKPFEVFLMRRHKNLKFMGGAYVFPGGGLDEEDCNTGLGAYARGLSAEEAKRKLNEPDISGETALGLFFAAVRETFEEAGILIAASPEAGELNFNDTEAYNRFDKYRKKIYTQEMSLKDLAQKENLLFRFDLLMPYAHWITPEFRDKRFDTRFLLAQMPRMQKPIHDSIEMTESLWLTPEEALEQKESKKILLMPPTLKTIQELSQFSSIDQLFAVISSRRIQPILPQRFFTEYGFGVKLPYDPEYSISKYKQPPRPDEPSRVIIADNRNKDIRFDESKIDGFIKFQQ